MISDDFSGSVRYDYDVNKKGKNKGKKINDKVSISFNSGYTEYTFGMSKVDFYNFVYKCNKLKNAIELDEKDWFNYLEIKEKK